MAKVPPRLSPVLRREAPPVRALHLGLGAFHRAHQAWYTQIANGSGDSWGISAFTGRSPAAAALMARNDCVYHVVERSALHDRVQRVESIVNAVPASESGAWLKAMSQPEVAVLTVTVTEAGYGPSAAPPKRIASALLERARAGADPIAVISCDNLLSNGRALRAAVLAASGPSADIIDDAATFVNTVVDRITPAVTAADVDVFQAASGIEDPAIVITEPYSEWVLSGGFPGGRPAWERAGATFVADVTPYEERKLWLLNAAHSVLASAGLLRGYATIAEAYGDSQLFQTVDALWEEQRVMIDIPGEELDRWLAQLRLRFANARMQHRLEQIQRDSPMKIAQRLVSPMRRRLEAGLPIGDAQRTAIEVWGRSLIELPPADAAHAILAKQLDATSPSDRERLLLERLTPEGTLA